MSHRLAVEVPQDITDEEIEDIQEFVNTLNYLSDEGFIDIEEDGDEVRLFPST